MAISRLCSIPICGKPHLAKGLCSMHYTRAIRPPRQHRPRKTVVFYETVVLAHNSRECLAWPFARSAAGYGQINTGGSVQYVHRLACEAMHGAPPTPAHEVAHSCGNGHLGCVNRHHLSWKTKLENAADRLLHGTVLRGENAPHVILTEKDVLEIVALKGTMMQTDIAKMYGVALETVNSIYRKQNWGWLTKGLL